MRARATASTTGMLTVIEAEARLTGWAAGTTESLKVKANAPLFCDLEPAMEQLPEPELDVWELLLPWEECDSLQVLAFAKCPGVFGIANIAVML